MPRIVIDNNSWFDIIGSGNTGTIAIPQEFATKLFQKHAIQETNYAANELGLYSFASFDRNKRASFLSLRGAKHILQPRVKGCDWRAKGKILQEAIDVFLNPVEANMEICPDPLWNSCFEPILGVGNGINSFYSTAEGQALLMELMRIYYLGLGNSYAELVEFGNHYLIEDANTDRTYTVEDLEWKDYYDQQKAAVGHMTIVDELRANGEKNFIYEIPATDISGNDYVGDAMALIEKVISSASGTFATYLKSRSLSGRLPIIRVSPSIYMKFEAQFMNSLYAAQNPLYYQYQLTGVQPNGMSTMPGVLKYKNCWVVCEDSWGAFDAMTGYTTHRVLLTAPANFGIAHDVRSVNQFGGQGLVLQATTDLRDGGKILASTNYDLGTAVIDKELMINFSYTHKTV